MSGELARSCLHVNLIDDANHGTCEDCGATDVDRYFGVFVELGAIPILPEGQTSATIEAIIVDKSRVDAKTLAWWKGQQ